MLTILAPIDQQTSHITYFRNVDPYVTVDSAGDRWNVTNGPLCPMSPPDSGQLLSTRTSKPTFSSTNFQERTLSHTLALSGAIAKKIDACSRQHIHVKDTNGGFVVQFSTAYYELVIANLPRYIIEAQRLKLGKSVNDRDQTQACQSSMMQISYNNGRPCCTVNLFHTTSSALINGASVQKFMNEHMVRFNEVIQDRLAAQEINRNNLNKSFRSSLSDALNSSGKPLQGDDQSQSSQVDRSQAAIMLAEESPEYICPLCDLVADTDVIFCELCLSWTHIEHVRILICQPLMIYRVVSHHIPASYAPQRKVIFLHPSRYQFHYQ